MKKIGKFKLILITIFTALVLIAWTEGDVPAFDTFAGFLVWLGAVNGGAWVLASWFVSWTLEYFPQWAGQSSKFKAWAVGIIAVLIWYGSGLLLERPDLVEGFEVVFDVIQVWLGMQLAHRWNSRKGIPIK